jgi:P-type Cu+ transporter
MLFILNPDGKYIREREIDALLVQPGDVLNVPPGSKVPADGVVVWGTSHVNESMITGESAPILKEVSSVVIGGTMNLHDILHIQATKVGTETVLSQIISLVETAQMSKAPIQKFADYVSVLFSLSEILCWICELILLAYELFSRAVSFS